MACWGVLGISCMATGLHPLQAYRCHNPRSHLGKLSRQHHQRLQSAGLCRHIGWTRRYLKNSGKWASQKTRLSKIGTSSGHISSRNRLLKAVIIWTTAGLAAATTVRPMLHRHHHHPLLQVPHLEDRAPSALKVPAAPPLHGEGLHQRRHHLEEVVLRVTPLVRPHHNLRHLLNRPHVILRRHVVCHRLGLGLLPLSPTLVSLQTLIALQPFRDHAR